MKRLYILEGPDGGGKTTLGATLSSRLGVQVSNHGPYKGEDRIWQHYMKSMLPACIGLRNVIMDRCWIAEPIYGEVYRKGLNRIRPWQERALEHIAGKCFALVI